MTLNVTPEEHNELEQALALHLSNLVSTHARRCYSGGPDETGIAMSVRRLKIEALLRSVRLNKPVCPVRTGPM